MLGLTTDMLGAAIIIIPGLTLAAYTVLIGPKMYARYPPVLPPYQAYCVGMAVGFSAFMGSYLAASFWTYVL